MCGSVVIYKATRTSHNNTYQADCGPVGLLRQLDSLMLKSHHRPCCHQTHHPATEDLALQTQDQLTPFCGHCEVRIIRSMLVHSNHPSFYTVKLLIA